MRANRRLWRWAITLSFPLLVKAGVGCAEVAGIYLPTEKCQNGKHDDGEEKIDCGGVCLGACPDAACKVSHDCASDKCVEGKCAEPRCDDEIRNGVEIGVDTCPGDSICNSEKKCSSVPAIPSCDNEAKDDGESDLDCGGSCLPCTNNKQCEADKDCLSERCVDGACQCIPCGEFIKGHDPSNTGALCDVEVYNTIQGCGCLLDCIDVSAPSCKMCLMGADAGGDCVSAADACKRDKP